MLERCRFLRSKDLYINDLERYYYKDSPMYNHSLPIISSVLTSTRRIPGLPVVSTDDDDDMKYRNFNGCCEQCFTKD